MFQKYLALKKSELGCQLSPKKPIINIEEGHPKLGKK
jgi:hypothetical protein